MISSFYPYTNPGPGEIVLPAKSGACDPNMTDWFGRLHPFRYSTLALRGTLVAGDVVFATQATSIFDKGEGEPGTAPMTENLTNSYTDLAKTGAMVDTGARFVILGVAVSPVECWSVPAGDPANGTNRQFATVVSTDYGPRAQRALAHSFSMELRAEAANACRYHFGSPGDWGNFWGANGNAQGGSPGGVPGVFTMLGVPAVSAGYKDSGQLFIAADMQQALTIAAGATPFPAGRDLIAAFRVYLFGYGVPPSECK